MNDAVLVHPPTCFGEAYGDFVPLLREQRGLWLHPFLQGRTGVFGDNRETLQTHAHELLNALDINEKHHGFSFVNGALVQLLIKGIFDHDIL